MNKDKIPYAIVEFVKAKGRVSYPDLLLFFQKIGVSQEDLEEPLELLLQKGILWEPHAGDIEVFE